MCSRKFYLTVIMLSFPALLNPGVLRGDGLEDRLAASAVKANEAFLRCRRYLEGWLRHLDPASGLLRQSLAAEGNLWTPENSAADNFPFMVIAARFTRPELERSLFHESLIGEKSYAADRWGLPSAFDLNKKAKLERDTGRLIFGASEYAKDGLAPMVEILGRGAWSARMEELAEGIFTAAPVETAFGALPSADAEVNGEMLQVLCSLFWMTGREIYLEWARRIGDAYCYEVLPGNYGVPAHFWDFGKHTGDSLLKLRDHGCEIVSGLTLLFAIEKERNTPRARSYYPAISRMLGRIEEIGTDSTGIFFNEVSAVNGERTRPGYSDCWGYDYYAWYTFWLATGEERYLKPVRQALRSLQMFKDYPWEPRQEGGQSQDGIADAVEGALGLLSRLPEPSAFDWVEHEINRMFSFQKPDGTIEGWWGDGNFCRTALMYAFYNTSGAYCRPWREDLLLAGSREGDGLEIYLRASKPWSGELHLDPPRHRTYLGLPSDYPRINAFPEWYTVDPLEIYQVTINGGKTGRVLGQELIEGYPVELRAMKALRLNIRRKIPDTDSREK